MVDQQEALARHGVIRRKCAIDIGAALAGVKTDLLASFAHAHQPGWLQRQTGGAAKGDRQQFGLIVTALAQTRLMQWHRDNGANGLGQIRPGWLGIDSD